MLLALAFDTVLMVAINIASHKNTNLINPEHVPLLTPEELTDRVLGSKLTLVTEQSQILVTWLVKTCLLIMYSRLTSVHSASSRTFLTDEANRFGNIQRLCIKLVAGYVAFGFVLMEVSHPRPLSSYLRQKMLPRSRAFLPLLLLK